jgi:hypothetical protein
MPEYNDPQSNKVTSDTKPLKKGKTEVVKDIISKGRTMTGQKPDEIILNPVLEAKEKRAVFAFGRFNPPTIGHEKLIHKVEDTAKSVGGEAHVIASHTEGNSKNPLPKEKKVEYLKKIAGKGTNVRSSTSEHPTLLHQLSALHEAGVQHITMVAGSDRVNEFHKLINKYNGVKGTHGHYNFKSINVVSAGDRDPDAEGTTGMSGTKMRDHARSGNMKEFKKGLPKGLHPHAKEIADQIKSVKEDVDDIFDHFILETSYQELDQIYDLVINEEYDEDKEISNIKKQHKSINHSNSHFRDDGTSTRVVLFKHDTPGEPKSNLVKDDINHAFEGWVDDQNPDPKYREAVNRHQQDRKKIQLVPRDQRDRKQDDRPFRQQQIQKKIIDEKKSPWEKMLTAMPRLKDSEQRAQAAKAGLQQAAKDYQAILDKEAKKNTNESVNSSGGGGVRGLGNVSGSPDGESSGYVGQNIADADTRDNIIKAHVNQHFTMHMNASVADQPESDTQDQIMNKTTKRVKEDVDVDELFEKTFGKVPVAQSSEMQRIKRKQYYRKRRMAMRHYTHHSKNAYLGVYRNTALGQHHNFIPYRHLHDDVTSEMDPINYLEDKLNVATDTSYDGIDKIMRQVADNFNIDVHDLHDMWVKKTGITPDQYVNEAIYFGKNRERYIAQRKPLSQKSLDILKAAEDEIGRRAVPSQKAIDDRKTKTRADYEKEVPSDYKPKVNEDLRQWFKDKWVRMDTKGNIKGDCAREEGEGKPKCLPLAKARAMDKTKRAAAAVRKRREDPVADRSGKGGAPINVRTEEVEHIDEGSKPTNPSLWSRAKALARSKFDVYPSAYANGWAAKWYKSKGGGWRSG